MSEIMPTDVWIKANELIEAHGKERAKKLASSVIQGIKDKKDKTPVDLDVLMFWESVRTQIGD